MKTTIHRILMVLSVVILTAIGASAYDFKVNGIYYNIVSDGVEVTYGSQKYFDDIKIPAKVTYNSVEYNVVGVGTDAFNYCQITSVSLPDGLKRVGSYAFYRANIRNITIPSTLEYIGSYAFYGTNIKDITVPPSVKHLGFGTFENCAFLANVVLNCEVQNKELVNYYYIGTFFMFSDSQELETVKVAGNIQVLGGGFFRDVKMKELYIGENVKYITNWTFIRTTATDIYFMNQNPPEVRDYQPSTITISNYLGGDGSQVILGCVNIHVPEGSTEAYRRSRLMSFISKNVNFIEDLPSTSIDETVVDNSTEITVADGRIIAEGVVEVYATDGRLVGRGLSDDLPTFTPGLYIVRTPFAAKKIIVR